MGRSLKTTTPTHCHVRHVRKSELDSVRRAKSTTSRVSKELPPPSTEPRHYHSPSSLVLTDFNHRSSTRNSHAKSDLMPRIHSVSSQFMLPSPQIEMRCLSVKEINPRTPTVSNLIEFLSLQSEVNVFRSPTVERAASEIRECHRIVSIRHGWIRMRSQKENRNGMHLTNRKVSSSTYIVTL